MSRRCTYKVTCRMRVRIALGASCSFYPKCFAGALHGWLRAFRSERPSSKYRNIILSPAVEDARSYVPALRLCSSTAGYHPLYSCTTTRGVVSRFERGWWDDGPRACPSSRYRARDRETSRGRPPSRGHEGRLVSQTQRPLELTDRSSSDDSSEPTMFLQGPSAASRETLCIGPLDRHQFSEYSTASWLCRKIADSVESYSSSGQANQTVTFCSLLSRISPADRGTSDYIGLARDHIVSLSVGIRWMFLDFLLLWTVHSNTPFNAGMSNLFFRTGQLQI